MVRPGGLIIADSSLVHGVPNRQDIRFVPIQASALASDAGNMTFAAIILLGCLAACTGCFTRQSFEQALRDGLPERHHHLIPQEMALFDRGAAFATAGDPSGPALA
jgi:2-oxoglutarate ferredoxin oxidoreductase subunit gamma